MVATATYNSRVYQSMSTTVGMNYTVSCDIYDYEYTQLDAVPGTDPLVASYSGFPIIISNNKWLTLVKNFTATSTKATVTIFGRRFP